MGQLSSYGEIGKHAGLKILSSVLSSTLSKSTIIHIVVYQLADSCIWDAEAVGSSPTYYTNLLKINNKGIPFHDEVET